MESLKEKLFSTLRSSERLFKLDMVYLTKGAFWTTLRFIIGTAASIITTIAFGNLLPRETYGTYNYLLALGASLNFLTLSGTGTAVMRAVARGYENIVPAALKLHLKYSVMAIVTILTASIYYGYKGNVVFSLSLAMLAIAYPVSEAFHVYVQVLTGRKRFDVLTKISLIVSLITTLITVFTIYLTQNILIIIAVFTTVILATNIIAYRKTTKNLEAGEMDLSQFNEMRRTALHLTGAGVIGVIAAYIDKIMLFQVAGPASLAVYGISIAGPEKLKSLVKNWAGIAMPSLAQRTLSEVRHVIHKRILISILVGFLLSMTYILLAPLLFKILLPRYLDAIIYSQVYSLGLILVPASIYIGIIFTSQNMLRAFYISNVGSHVTRIVLFIIFGLLWQTWGLIFAYLLFSLFNTLYSIIIWEVEMRRLIKKQS